MEELIHRIPHDCISGIDELLQREWLVTNGLGGYASGTLAGVLTRRYHGYAWLKLHPEQKQTARGLLDAFAPRLDEYCIGTINEVFDAEEPFQPRGCIAQAWSVAEVLRCLVKTSD